MKSTDADQARATAPDERSKPRIAATPEVPDTDPTDNSEAHARPPGVVAALYRADRGQLAGRPGAADAVAVLQALRVRKAR